MATKSSSGLLAPLAPLSNPTIVSALVIAIAIAIQLIPDTGIPSITGPPAINKPYRTLTAFYSHYRMEHTDYTNRLLHCVGTTITSLMLLRSPKTALAGTFAASIGYILSGLFAGQPNGAYEGAALFLMFALTTKQLTGSVSTAIVIPLIAYSFAWVGHFYHEHNKPATFIYPTFSLISDYRMVFNVYTGQESL